MKNHYHIHLIGDQVHDGPDELAIKINKICEDTNSELISTHTVSVAGVVVAGRLYGVFKFLK